MEERTAAKFLFIGGAPRSGTTLLVNLLDTHPDLLIFPFEHAAIERYFWNIDRIQEYALEDFINKRSEGQQTIPANALFLKEYAEKIKREYKKDFSVDINPFAFAEAYTACLRKKTIISLKDILNALMEGLSHSNPYAGEKYGKVKYFVFKQPYYTDLFAREVKQLIPDAKFIHINRDPFARYASAKKRGISSSILTNRRLGPINKVNFVQGHAEVDISAYFMAQENQKKLQDHYKIVSYEKMLQDSEMFFKDIFSWLSVPNSTSYLNPTLLGKPAFAGSNFVKKEGIDESAADRRAEYEDVTSWNERIVHKHYLIKGGLFKKTKINPVILVLAYVLPFKRESLKHYLYKTSHIYHLLKSAKNIKFRLPQGLKMNKYFISGNI